jgi:hypothetical protein
VAYLKSVLAAKGPTIVERLLSPKLPVFSSAKDLSTFIKMHSDEFDVHANLVSLVHNPPPSSNQHQDNALTNNDGKSEYCIVVYLYYLHRCLSVQVFRIIDHSYLLYFERKK